MKQILIFTIAFIPLFGFSQTGPAGVGSSSDNIIWLIPDSGVLNTGGTQATNGQAVDIWEDQSGNGNDVSQSNDAPTYTTGLLNGSAGVSFDGNDNLTNLSFSGLSSSAGASIFSVVLPDNNTENQVVCSGHTTTNSSFPRFQKYSLYGTHRWLSGGFSNTWLYGSSTAVSASTWYVYSSIFDGTEAVSLDRTNLWVDGVIQTMNTGGGAIGTNTGAMSRLYLGSWNSGFYFNGDITELLMYNIEVNEAQRIIIENYLAAKYGQSLASNDLYDEDDNGDFDYEVAGIGQAPDGSNHTDAQGSGIIRILNPTNLDNDEFLIWGHDNGVQQAIETTDVPGSVQARFDRVWRASEVNTSSTAVDVGAIDIRFDLTGLGTVTASDLRLLVDTDNDGLFSDETPISGVTSLGGNVYEFAGVTAIANNLRFTLGTINISQTPLPVELIAFEVNLVNNGQVGLNWQTASEINNDFFTIERSKDGINWEIIEKIKGAGNSSTILSYSGIDKNPYRGISYYRLKQTDFDGQFEYSQIRSVNIDELMDSQIQIYPNPAENQINIIGDVSELKQLKIYNTLGQDVTGLIVIINKSNTSLIIDLSNLRKGMYWIKTKTTANKVYKQ